MFGLNGHCAEGSANYSAHSLFSLLRTRLSFFFRECDHPHLSGGWASSYVPTLDVTSYDRDYCHPRSDKSLK